jgi:hypothetical protein
VAAAGVVVQEAEVEAVEGEEGQGDGEYLNQVLPELGGRSVGHEAPKTRFERN